MHPFSSVRGEDLAANDAGGAADTPRAGWEIGHRRSRS
nr:hypothetical protein Iba_scaffold8948CG0010 [Ipomoea batatas]